MIYLAHDGSRNSDWVSRYAMRMASHSPEKKLILIHVLDGRLPEETLSERIDAVRKECKNYKIDFESVILPKRRSVHETLIENIPAGTESFCLTGTRVKEGHRGYLAGTVSERLLRSRLFHVLAIHVVQPGLMGNPGEFLFPVSGHPQGFQAGLPFVRLLLPDIEVLHVLRIMKVPSLLYQYLSPKRASRMKLKGMRYVSSILNEIKDEILDDDKEKIRLDSRVVLTSDWKGEILIQASHLGARMILLGASDRRLPGRYFYGNSLEHMLRKSPCDMGIYRGI